jgi:microcin C transport system permease protein
MRRITLSPLNQRRFRNFRGNWRGWWSLWLFLLLFAVSLFSNVIASDRPIVVSYKGEWLFPIVINYP